MRRHMVRYSELYARQIGERAPQRQREERAKSDNTVMYHINDLVREEEHLWERASHGGLAPEQQERLAAIKVELDQ